MQLCSYDLSRLYRDRCISRIINPSDLIPFEYISACITANPKLSVNFMLFNSVRGSSINVYRLTSGVCHPCPTSKSLSLLNYPHFFPILPSLFAPQSSPNLDQKHSNHAQSSIQFQAISTTRTTTMSDKAPSASPGTNNHHSSDLPVTNVLHTDTQTPSDVDSKDVAQAVTDQNKR